MLILFDMLAGICLCVCVHMSTVWACIFICMYACTCICICAHTSIKKKMHIRHTHTHTHRDSLTDSLPHSSNYGYCPESITAEENRRGQKKFGKLLIHSLLTHSYYVFLFHFSYSYSPVFMLSGSLLISHSFTQHSSHFFFLY